MNEIKLRGHHIHLIYARKNPKDLKDRITNVLSKLMIKRLYGKECSYKIKDLEKKITDSTIVETTLETDYVCRELLCPYLQFCENGDNEHIVKEFMKRLPAFVRSNIKFNRAGYISDKEYDAHHLARFGLEPGKKYDFGELKIKNDAPTAEDVREILRKTY